MRKCDECGGPTYRGRLCRDHWDEYKSRNIERIAQKGTPKPNTKGHRKQTGETKRTVETKRERYPIIDTDAGSSRDLWCAVIWQAFGDAISDAELFEQMTPGATKIAKLGARAFFDLNYPTFTFICELAEYDPRFICERANRRIKLHDQFRDMMDKAMRSFQARYSASNQSLSIEGDMQKLSTGATGPAGGDEICKPDRDLGDA